VWANTAAAYQSLSGGRLRRDRRWSWRAVHSNAYDHSVPGQGGQTKRLKKIVSEVFTLDGLRNRSILCASSSGNRRAHAGAGGIRCGTCVGLPHLIRRSSYSLLHRLRHRLENYRAMALEGRADVSASLG